jgi:hypothetical protein
MRAAPVPLPPCRPLPPAWPASAPTRPAIGTPPPPAPPQVVREERGDGTVALTITLPGPLVQKRFTEAVDILRK